MAGWRLDDLRNQVLIELNRAANSTLAELPSGTGSNGVSISSTSNITGLINDAKDQICRTAFLYAVSGTKAVSSGGGPMFPLSGFTFSGAKAFRCVLDLFWTPTSGSQALLTWLSPEAIRDFYPARATVGSGAVKYWSTLIGDRRTIEIYQKPDTGGTLTGQGYGLPVDLSADSDTADWLPNERYRAIVSYVCARLCRKRLDDPLLAIRKALFEQEYDAERLRMRAELSPEIIARFLDPVIPLGMQAEPPDGGAQDGGQ